VLSRWTISSFQATALPRSSVGLVADIPKTDLPAAAVFNTSNSSATWIIALEGMQPTFRHVPPSRPCSTITVSTPSWPARMAQT